MPGNKPYNGTTSVKLDKKFETLLQFYHNLSSLIGLFAWQTFTNVPVTMKYSYGILATLLQSYQNENRILMAPRWNLGLQYTIFLQYTTIVYSRLVCSNSFLWAKHAQQPCYLRSIEVSVANALIWHSAANSIIWYLPIDIDWYQ